MSSPLREIMKERPIIFSGDDVRAILDGRKTMTRRVVKTNNHSTNLDTYFMDGEPSVLGMQFTDGTNVKCPYGKVGDRLWVRETWTQRWDDDKSEFDGYLYAADGSFVVHVDGGQNADGSERSPWKSPIHMPREASRLTLEITGVRVERLQDISEEDAKAEGFEPIIFDEFDIAEIMFNDPDCQEAEVLEILGPGQIPAKADFSLLWDRINGKRPKLPANKESKRYQRVKRWLGKHPDVSWASNPWCWVISFKPLCN